MTDNRARITVTPGGTWISEEKIMATIQEFAAMQQEVRTMSKGDLLHLQMQIENAIRERRLKDVVFYFNNLAKQEKNPVNNHAVAAYNVICKELQKRCLGSHLEKKLGIASPPKLSPQNPPFLPP